MKAKGIMLILSALMLGAGCQSQKNWKELPADRTGGRRIVLQNKLLAVTIDLDRGGIVTSFVPANSGHDEVFSNSAQRQSFCRMHLAGLSNAASGKLASAKADFKVLKETAEETVVRCTVPVEDAKLGKLEFQQGYTLKADSAVLYVSWKITNRSGETKTLTPWHKNIVSGYKPPNIQFGSKGLDTDTSIMLSCGAFRKLASGADCFVEPARNWFARVPKRPGPDKNIVLGIFDYSEVFQFYTVHFKYLHTLELICRNIDLEPGQSWTFNYLIASAGSLPDVRFASPDAAADLNRKDGKLELQITGTREIKDAEVELLTGTGKSVGRIRADIPACKTVTLNFPDAEGDLFRLKVMERGKDLQDPGKYAPKGAPMLSTLKTVQSPRRPVNPETVLQDWPRKHSPFETMKPRAVAAVPLETALPGLQAWPADSLTRVLEQDYPVRMSPAQPPVPYPLAAAQGEREYFQLAVRNTGKSELKDFSLELSADGIPAENLRWNVLDYITTTQPSLGLKLVGRWPEVLDPARSFAVKAGQTRTVWIEVKVPRGQKAGVYSGKVRLMQGKQLAAEMPFRVRVFDFELPKTPHFRLEAGRFFGDRLQMARRYGFKGTAQQLLTDVSEALLDHRMSPRGLTVSVNDLEAYERNLKHYIDNGANTFFIPSLSVISKKKRDQLEKIHDKYGVTKRSYVYAFDEIHADQIPKVKQWCETWHKESKIPILVVYYGGPVEPLYGSIDIWCRAHWKEDRRLLADRLGKDEIWSTNTPFFPLDNDPVLGRAKVWQTFSEGMSGCLLWAVASWTASPYDLPFRSGTNLTGVFFYPAPEGVRPGARFKMMADAAEDFEYLFILREEVRKAKAAKRSPELVERAEKLLSDAFFRKSGLTPAECLLHHLEAGELIEQFRRLPR